MPKKQLKEHQKVSKQFKTKNKNKQVQKKTKFQQIRRLVDQSAPAHRGEVTTDLGHMHKHFSVLCVVLSWVRPA